MINLEDFKSFVLQQGDAGMMIYKDTDTTAAFMRDFVRDPRRYVEPAYFTPNEVIILKLVFK